MGHSRMITVGDKYEWHGIDIEVTGIDPGGRFAVIHCVIPAEPNVGPYDQRRFAREWDKEQPTPDGTFPADWNKIDEK